MNSTSSPVYCGYNNASNLRWSVSVLRSNRTKMTGMVSGSLLTTLFHGRFWQKIRIEVVCCYVSHHPTVLFPLSRLQCDNQILVYFLVNSSHLYFLSRKFISRITLTFRFNLTSHAKYIVLCGVSHLVMYFIWGIKRVWCFISHITLVVDSNLLCHIISFVAFLVKFWQLGSALVTKRVWYLR